MIQAQQPPGYQHGMILQQHQGFPVVVGQQIQGGFHQQQRLHHHQVNQFPINDVQNVVIRTVSPQRFVQTSPQRFVQTSPQRIVQCVPSPQQNVSGPHMVRVGSPQITTVPYRGVPQVPSDGQLNYSISNRKGTTGYGLPHPAEDPYHPFPPHVQEHIQRRPYSNKELFQDLEGLDIIRVQATRISNLLDRIEILEKEVSRQDEIDKEKDKDLLFWEKQFVGLENNKELSRQQIDRQTLQEIDMEQMHYTDDQVEIERAISMQLREIEELNEEIAYYKSISIPKEFEADSLEVRRLQDEEQRFISLNADYNKELLILTHYMNQE